MRPDADGENVLVKSMLLSKAPIDIAVIVRSVRDAWGRIICFTGAVRLKSRGTPLMVMTGA